MRLNFYKCSAVIIVSRINPDSVAYQDMVNT
jgi:hypothetical protein